MKKPFIHPEFLLDTKTGSRLYHEFAEPLPIIDFHCHLPAADIAADRRFENLTRIWLAHDHYKWRAMRACGVDERLVTGNAPDREKFDAWARTVPKTLRNPLYHWTHLELRRPFGIDDVLLDETTAGEVWTRCNALLATDAFSAQGILEAMSVEVVCTTDDPIDTLDAHRAYARGPHKARTKLVPAWRPDRAMAVEDGGAFRAYLPKLEAAAGREISSFASFIEALRARHADFHDLGCRLSDHGLETAYADDTTDAEAERLFARLRGGSALSPDEVSGIKSAMMREFAVMDHEAGWVQQLHIGALRNVNSRMTRALGPDSGFDAIADPSLVVPLARFLDRLDAAGRLPKTVLFNLNPRDNEVLAALAGCFQEGPAAGKIQFGPAWWFLDQLDGMTRQLEALSALGLLGSFIGMTTDSRSFLSYARHEYFRRLLCRILGRDIEQGLLPNDLGLVGGLVADVCHGNAKRYFPFAEAS